MLLLNEPSFARQTRSLKTGVNFHKRTRMAERWVNAVVFADLVRGCFVRISLFRQVSESRQVIRSAISAKIPRFDSNQRTKIKAIPRFTESVQNLVRDGRNSLKCQQLSELAEEIIGTITTK